MAQPETTGENRSRISYGSAPSASENVHTACSVFGKTVAGLGVGIVTGISLAVVAAASEVAVPAILLLKVLGFTGGAFGFVSGIKKD